MTLTLPAESPAQTTLDSAAVMPAEGCKICRCYRYSNNHGLVASIFSQFVNHDNYLVRLGLALVVPGREANLALCPKMGMTIYLITSTCVQYIHEHKRLPLVTT